MLRACFVVGAASGSISAEESAEVNEIAKELDARRDVLNQVRAEFHERLSSVQAVRRIAGRADDRAARGAGDARGTRCLAALVAIVTVVAACAAAMTGRRRAERRPRARRSSSPSRSPATSGSGCC